MSTASNALNNIYPTINSVSGTSGTVTFVPPEGTPKVTGKLAEAKSKAQAEFVPVPKTKTATIKTDKGTYSYDYADLADVLGMALPRLTKYGISFSQPLKRKDGKLYIVTQIQLGEEIETDDGLEIPERNVQPREMGTYLTYFKRYGASSLLGIVSEADTDGPPPVGAQQTTETRTPSASGQNYPRTATGQTNNTPAAIVKRGRPAVTKATEIVPTTPVENARPQIATDQDLPDNIGDKASPEERKEFLARLKEHIKIVGVEPMKKYMGGDTNLTKIAWTNVLAKLDAAQAEGKLKELVG